MKTVVMFAGKINSGKNLAAETLKNIFEDEGISAEVMMLAQGVKDGCREDFKRLADYLNALAKEEREEVGNDYLADLLEIKDENWYEKKTPLTRILLQTYGTEIFRNRVDRNYWTEALAKRILESKSDRVVVSDMRFPDECDHLKNIFEEAGEEIAVKSVLVKRSEREESEAEIVDDHASETSLEDYRFDYVLRNDGTKDDMLHCLRKTFVSAKPNS